MYTCNDCMDVECPTKMSDPDGPMCEEFTLIPLDDGEPGEGPLYDRITALENEVTTLTEDVAKLEATLYNIIRGIVREIQ